MNINIKNEYGRLKKVLMCSPKGYTKPTTAIDWQTDAAIKNNTLPSVEELMKEHDEFVSVLERHGTEIVYADIVPGAIDQMFTRDPYVAIDDNIMICNMKEVGRKKEIAGIKKLLKKIDKSKVIHVPKDAIVEGGDVIVHNDTIYVGQNGLRTDARGLEFVKKVFGDRYDVVPINLQKSKIGKDILHLDCAFNPLSSNEALVFADGIHDKSMGRIRKRFDPIGVSEEEQFELGTNVFGIGNKCVVAQKRHYRIIGALERKGFKVEQVELSKTAKLGGAFRCTTCPIERE